MSPAEFWDFCADNRKLPAELMKEGDVIITPPTGFETSDRNLEILLQLRNWAKIDKIGVVTKSNSGFVLPDAAVYAPDAAGTLRTRVNGFTPEERQKFLPPCPDFVIELRSPSDNLGGLLEKMQEWIENGARLAWLIDPKGRQVHIYRPGREP
jgi:Uma2 family endonuclease